MTTGRLELRGPIWVFIAYLVGPASGLTASWVLWWVSSRGAAAINPEDNWNPLGAWLAAMVVGMPISLLVELVLVTPVLLGLERHPWRWITGWTVAGAGFLLGFAPYLAFALVVGSAYFRDEPLRALADDLQGAAVF